MKKIITIIILLFPKEIFCRNITHLEEGISQIIIGLSIILVLGVYIRKVFLSQKGYLNMIWSKVKSYLFISWSPLPLYLSTYDYRIKIFDEIRYDNGGGFFYILFVISLIFITSPIEKKIRSKVLEKHLPFFHGGLISVIVLFSSLLIDDKDFHLTVKIFIIWIMAILQWFIQQGKINDK